jgi:hypothetical protein
MKNYASVLLFTFLFCVSCSKEKTIGDNLIGKWIYERETFSSNSTVEDPDTRGVMTFNEDETGSWISDNGFNFTTETEWDLQGMDSKILITKILPIEISSFGTSQIYDIKQNGEDELTFTFEVSFPSPVDSIASLVRFDNIILTRQ